MTITFIGSDSEKATFIRQVLAVGAVHFKAPLSPTRRSNPERHWKARPHQRASCKDAKANRRAHKVLSTSVGDVRSLSSLHRSVFKIDHDHILRKTYEFLICLVTAAAPESS